MPDPTPRHAIPAVTQYATATLIDAIAYQGHPPGDDPNWATSGAPDQPTYARWCTRLCGMACLHMALTARDGHAPTLFDLLDGALTHGCYRTNPDGTVHGLIYAPFATYLNEAHQLHAEVITDLDPRRLTTELDQGHLVIASVHKEIRRPDHPAPGTGGHLVLVTAHHDGHLTFHNPSGHHPQAVTATLPTPTFDTFFAHRGIALHL